MAVTLPYLVSPGSIKNALERIRAAATPPRVTGDFVKTVLNIKGGTGLAIPPFLKKIGLVSSDGTPTNLYVRFRNPNEGGAAIAEAMKSGYRPLMDSNEYFYLLKDDELLSLIVQVTGSEAKSPLAKLTLSTINYLKGFADFKGQSKSSKEATHDKQPEELSIMSSGNKPEHPPVNHRHEQSIGMNLSYTINLNLPATTDQAVFNAIFRSLKEHLLINE
jgi:hypothetical protein